MPPTFAPLWPPRRHQCNGTLHGLPDGLYPGSTFFPASSSMPSLFPNLLPDSTSVPPRLRHRPFGASSTTIIKPSTGAPSPPWSTPRFYFGTAKALPPAASIWSFNDNSNGALRPVPSFRLELLQHSASLRLSDLLSEFSIVGSARALSPVTTTGSPPPSCCLSMNPRKAPGSAWGSREK